MSANPTPQQQMRLLQVLLAPVVSEKSYALMADGKYTFRIDDRAHKTQVARAVERIFDVTVVEVDSERAEKSRAAIEKSYVRPFVPIDDTHSTLAIFSRSVWGKGDMGVNRERVDVTKLASHDEVQIGKFKLVFFAGSRPGGGG